MKAVSIRSFVGSLDYQMSRSFYKAWGFQELVTSPKMSYFHIDGCGFYLQDYYVKDWVDNTMLFLEVDDLKSYWENLTLLKLEEKFDNVKVIPPKDFDWGSEGFLYDPSGALWHIGEFEK